MVTYAELLDRVRSHCAELDGCWLWQGSADKGAYPRINQDGSSRSLRRVLHEAAGHEVERGSVVSTKCGTRLCVNPDHLIVRTRSAVTKKAASEGKIFTDARRKKITRHLRESRSPLTMDDVRAIRLSGETQVALAKRYRVSQQTISNVCNYRVWKDDGNVWGALFR